MKKYLDALPAFFSILFLSAIILKPDSLGFIFGFIASAFLFGYQQYLFRTEQPDILGELEKLRQETDARVMKIQEKAEKELTSLRDDVAKFSLSMTRIPGAVERPKDRPKVQF